MDRHALFALVAALGASLANPTLGAGERLTEKCNPNFRNGLVYVGTNQPQSLISIVAQPQSDADTYHRLWRPSAARERLLGSRTYAVLTFDLIQDTQQIASEIAADSKLRAQGVLSAWADGYGICFGVLPDPSLYTVTEYYNRVSNHYFLSSTDEENTAIDGGAAGPGWERTGETFAAIQPDGCRNSEKVQRFYTYGANTHFFTASASECGFLRRNDPGWVYEGEAFGAMLPVNGICPGRTTPIYRLYNNRWMFNDSNHRFVKRLDLYQQMRDRGWIGEGVAMCLDATGYQQGEDPS